MILKGRGYTTEDIVGVSVLLLRCKYNEQEFINLGWFVSNEYVDEELKENPPAQPLVDKVFYYCAQKIRKNCSKKFLDSLCNLLFYLIRKVEIDDLRVTTHSIKWIEEEAADEFPEANESVGHFFSFLLFDFRKSYRNFLLLKKL
ncbi:unnamed protein product [Caenorhabditis angaria]|uniref:Uncharacterized protein n=1 Tax=Caenorhabditis angaria TaxID=860376 RepID=A0A9P1IQ02_9PELO|nr:unnamed protein product [Caenorhabditis angaria]